MTSINEKLSNERCYYHHTAARRGYESRKGEGRLIPYKGRYGNGYIWLKPRYDTTQYVWAAYYIKAV